MNGFYNGYDQSVVAAESKVVIPLRMNGFYNEYEACIPVLYNELSYRSE